MAGITQYETGRVVRSMWAEAGIQFVSNLLETGGRIDLHAHSYDHVMLVTRGLVQVREMAEGLDRTFLMEGASAAHPYRLTMPAFHRHEITCLSGLAEVLCFWPAASADGHEGC